MFQPHYLIDVGVLCIFFLNGFRHNHQVQGWIVMLYDDSWGFAKLFGDLTGKHCDLSSNMYGYRNMQSRVDRC